MSIMEKKLHRETPEISNCQLAIGNFLWNSLFVFSFVELCEIAHGKEIT